MSLQEKLDAQRNELESAAPKETVAVMHRVTEDLANSELVKQAKKEGDNAPDFTLNNATGQPRSLDQMLSEGPLVLGFYRGRW